MNTRQHKKRVEEGLCWKCNVKMEKTETHYGYKCPKCGQVYGFVLLEEYKKMYGSKGTV